MRAHGSIDDVGRAAIRPPWPSPTELDRAYDVWAVRSAVDDLPPDERAVVRLQHLGGFTHRQIADQLGIPLGTVKSRSNRAHRRLAGRLGYLREETG